MWGVWCRAAQGCCPVPCGYGHSSRPQTSILLPLLRLCVSVQVFETRVNGAHVHPPSSLSRFIVRDRGNASPRLLRSTLNAVPVSTDMLNNSGMQFALSVQPLAQPDPEDDPVVVSCSHQAHQPNSSVLADPDALGTRYAVSKCWARQWGG